MYAYLRIPAFRADYLPITFNPTLVFGSNGWK